MPQCPRYYVLCLSVVISYAVYILLIYPAIEITGFLLRTYTKIDIGRQSEFSRWMYIGCLIILAPCYMAAYWWTWRKNRAKPLFVPKWKTSEPLEEEDVMCTICYDLIVDPHTLRCQHSFCKKCIDQCLPITRRCPACQQWVCWSSKNRAYKSKVLKYVKDNGREEEYEEVVQLKANIQPLKIGFCARLGPLLLPFMEVPRRPRRNHRRNRNRNHNDDRNEVPIRPASPMPQVERELSPLTHMMTDLSVNNVDELDHIRLHTPLVVSTPLSVIIEVPEDVLQDSISAAPSAQSLLF